MKRVMVYLLFFSNLIQAEVQNTIEVPELCEKISRRTYFIYRLDQTIDLFKNIDLSSATIILDRSLFKHPDILSIISNINKNRKLDSLFSLWDKLKEYKRIDDALLLQEFTKLILALSWQLLYSQRSLETSHGDIKLSLEGTSYTEAITLRHYYVERLKHAIAFLTIIPCNKKEIFEPERPGCDCSFITNYKFSHPAIRKTIDKLYVTNNLSPIRLLAQDFEQLRLINDPLFQKEFMILIFTAYRNLLVNNATKYQYPLTKNTLEIIMYLYENIEHIPVEQILDAIDLVAQELPVILEKYEFKKKIPWRTWLKKYWWVAGIVGAGLTYKILRIFFPPKRIITFTHPKQSNQPQHRPTSTSLLKDDDHGATTGEDDLP